VGVLGKCTRFEAAVVDQARIGHIDRLNEQNYPIVGGPSDRRAWGVSCQMTPVGLAKAITDPNPTAAKRHSMR